MTSRRFPFTHDTASQKVQAAEDAWNTCDAERVAAAYEIDSVWRNRDVYVTGRDEIITFLTQKWERELDYALRKNLWASLPTASPSASNTSAETATANGGAAMATSCGNSTSTASCVDAKPASTIWPSTKAIAAFSATEPMPNAARSSHSARSLSTGRARSARVSHADRDLERTRSIAVTLSA